MQIFHGPTLSPEEVCPYLPQEFSRHEFMLASSLSPTEWEELLSHGWRKFGVYFFRPSCRACQQCTPLRVDVKNFEKSRSQKRVWNKNQDLTVKFEERKYRPEIFHLYKLHSQQRFQQSPEDLGSEGDFWQNHYFPSTDGLQSEYYYQDQLIAVGLLDRSAKGLSSSYFIFDPKFEKRSLGVYGALAEIQWASQQGLEYYYLGYWIEKSDKMKYKSQFSPHQLFDWNQKKWINEKNFPSPS